MALAPPPQPGCATRIDRKTGSRKRAIRRRGRSFSMLKKTMPARGKNRNDPARNCQRCGEGANRAVLALRVMVRTDCTELPLGATEGRLKLHAIVAGRSEQASDTTPVKRLLAATVIEEVADCPAERVSEEGEAESWKSGGASLTTRVADADG